MFEKPPKLTADYLAVRLFSAYSIVHSFHAYATNSLPQHFCIALNTLIQHGSSGIATHR